MIAKIQLMATVFCYGAGLHCCPSILAAILKKLFFIGIVPFLLTELCYFCSLIDKK